jgi:hypothetical protein
MDVDMALLWRAAEAAYEKARLLTPERSPDWGRLSEALRATWLEIATAAVQAAGR